MVRFSFGCIFLTATMLMGCDSQQSQSPKAFSQHGITFQLPGDWSADDAENIGSTAFSVNCQKNGFDDSGLVIITCFSDSLDLNNVQRIFQNQLDSTSLYKLADVKFSPAKPGHFGHYETLQAHFTMSMLGTPHSGWLDAFYRNNHTFMVLRQQANEDSAKNKSGFALISKTLDVKQGQ